MKLWELKERYREGRGGTSTTGWYSETQLTQWINEAQNVLCTELLLLEAPLLEISISNGVTDYQLRRLYSTGTVTSDALSTHIASIDNKTVTRTSATLFDSTYTNRLLKHSSDPSTAWTNISKYISDSELELEVPYLGRTTSSGNIYTVEPKLVGTGTSWDSSNMWQGWVIEPTTVMLGLSSSAVVTDVDYENQIIYTEVPTGINTGSGYTAYINDCIFGGVRSVVAHSSDSSISIPLEWRSIKEIEDLKAYNPNTDSTTPEFFTTFSSDEETISIWPPPDSTYDTLRVYYYQYPKQMVNDYHSLSIPSAFQDLILDYVDELAKRSLGQEEKVALINALVQRGKGRLKSLRTSRQRTNAPYIRTYKEMVKGPRRRWPSSLPWNWSPWAASVWR